VKYFGMLFAFGLWTVDCASALVMRMRALAAWESGLTCHSVDGQPPFPPPNYSLTTHENLAKRP